MTYHHSSWGCFQRLGVHHRWMWVGQSFLLLENGPDHVLRSGERVHGEVGKVYVLMSKIQVSVVLVCSVAHCSGCRHCLRGGEERVGKVSGLEPCGVVDDAVGGEPFDGMHSVVVTCIACHSCCKEIPEKDLTGHYFA